MMHRVVFAIAVFIASSVLGVAQQDEPLLESTQLRFIRAYGGDNELAPPVVLITETDDPSIVGSSYATIEFDIRSEIIPNVYARLVHCNADWEEYQSFITSSLNRTSLVNWDIAPQTSRYYRYRGKLQLPNPQITLRHSGNYKVKLYNMDDDAYLGESRFFAVDVQAECRFNFMTDFYEPQARVSSIALTLEAIIDSRNSRLLDPFLHSVVFYRNHRWTEPYVVSLTYDNPDRLHRVGTAIRGIFPAGKIFRVSRLPAQNEYRVLDLSNLAQFPNTGQPVRIPFSDQRRNGMFLERANDGALVTTMISPLNDEYVPIEFMLDPQPGYPSKDDVFLSGSFNNWKPDRTWRMSYDPELNLYRLRQWIRRGRHNYMYATGILNVDTDEIRDLSYEEWEGNTAANSNSYVAFAYYRVQEYGGYDGIIAVGASNIYASGR